MEVMEAEWSSKVWTKLKLFCTSKTWISRSRPAEASNLWPTSEEKRLPRIRKLSLKWESELSFTYPISNSPLTPHPRPPPPTPKKKAEGKKGVMLRIPLKDSSFLREFSPSLGYIFPRALHRYPRVCTKALTVICNLQGSLKNSWRFPSLREQSFLLALRRWKRPQRRGARRNGCFRRLTSSPRIEVWGTRVEIPYWWRVITQIRVVFLIVQARKFA